MNGGKQQKHWYFFVFAILILATVLTANYTENSKLVLIPVSLLFLFGFGMLIAIAIKAWRQPDEEILKNFRLDLGGILAREQLLPKDILKAILPFAIFVLFYLSKTRDATGIPRFLFLAVVLIFAGGCLIGGWIGRKDRTKINPKQRHNPIRQEHFFAFLVGLIPCGFFCFFCVIGIVNGVWWFTVPIGMIFLFLFSRPLVAAVRSVLGNCRDRGAQHVRRERWNQGEEDLRKLRRDQGEKHLRRSHRDQGEKHLKKDSYRDPWDRPDKKF